MDGNEFLDPFDRLLEDVSAPPRIREIEAGGSSATLWEALQDSGFLDALAPEDAGGVGLSLADVGPLLQAVGRHAVPAPVAETMVARFLLAQAGIERLTGPIVLATLSGGQTAAVPLARIASHALLEKDGQLVLTPLAGATVTPTGVHHDLSAALSWTGEPAGPAFPAPTVGLRAIAAVLRAALIAGAADRLLQMTAAYAKERVQFGKPIGKQQAIQQQMAIMAEQTVAARIAAQIGCASGLPPILEAAAIAKQAASSAAWQVANIAHAVHGAIGISEEYDLQLYSRRLHEWRLADGAESYWAGQLGRIRLASACETSVDFIRQRLSVEAQP
jgi:acyl-CoA dehydrogenase